MTATRVIFSVVLFTTCLLVGCASGYKDFYRPVNGFDAQRISELRVSPAPSQPQVERARPGNADQVLDAYAKRGYIMIGNSMFNSGRPESEDSAVLQGHSVGADLVLILNTNYTGSITSAIPITTPRAAQRTQPHQQPLSVVEAQ